MAITATAQGKTFTFPDGTQPEQMGGAIDEFFAGQQEQQPVTQEQPEQKITEEAQQPTARTAGGRTAKSKQLTESRVAEEEAFLSSLSPERRELLESISPGEAALIGAGEGLTTIGRGLGIADQATPFEKEAFTQLRKVQPAATVGKFAAEAAPFIAPGLGVAGIVSTPLRVAATTALGATEGGIISRGEGKDVGTQILSAGIGGTVAGALELGIPIIGRMGGKLIRRILGKAPKGSVIDAAGNPSQEFIQALEKSDLKFEDILDDAVGELKGKVIEPDQAARQAFLKSQGLDPTKAQVTREAADFQAQQEAAKTSTKVRTALERQEALLSTRFDNAVIETGGEAARPTNTVIDSVVGKATVLDQEVSRLYKVAREAAPGEKNVRFEGLTKSLRDLAPSDRATEGAISSTVGDLQARGILDKNMKIKGKVSVEIAEEIRKGLNDLFDQSKPFRNSKLRDLKQSLDDDVFKAAGGDVFKQGRAAKTAFEKELSRAKISKFDSRKANLVRDVLENKINPDTLAKDVVFSKKWRDTDIKQLKDYLSTDDAGKAAFNDLRADVLQNIKDRAFIGEIDAQGFQSLSRDKLEKALKDIGQNKINVLFTGKERKFLQDMVKVSKIRAPVRGTALGDGPSGQAINKLRAEIRKGSILANLADSISFDKTGRAVLKASPEQIAKPLTGSQLRAPLAVGGAAASTQLLGDEQ